MDILSLKFEGNKCKGVSFAKMLISPQHFVMHMPLDRTTEGVLWVHAHREKPIEFYVGDGVVSVAVGQVKGKSEEEPDDEGGGGHCVGVALKQVKPASIEVKSEAAVVYFDEGLDH